MRQNALKARPKRRGKPQDEGERSVIADNILDRDFEADHPNQKWLADFTVAIVVRTNGATMATLDRPGLAVCGGRAGPVFP